MDLFVGVWSAEQSAASASSTEPADDPATVGAQDTVVYALFAASVGPRVSTFSKPRLQRDF